MSFTFSNDLFSDFHKDVYGYRPRDHRFYAECDEEKQSIWDELGLTFKENQKAERIAEFKAIENLETAIQGIINLGAEDRSVALRWMTQNETFCHSQDVEHWVWNQGVLFTDYGKVLLKELLEVVTYKESV
jgi:hypothetical protein